MNKEKKNNIIFYSNFEITTKLLENFNKDYPKIYLKLQQALKLLGNFNKRINVDIYEINDNPDKCYIKLWCEDLDGNIFIFCSKSNTKKDINILNKISNDNCELYDLALTKKFEITNSNIDLIQTKHTFNFKFGRLITDNINFYNLFLSNNVCYQIKLNNNNKIINIKNLLNKLNNLEDIPNLKTYLDIFDYILQEENIQYDKIIITAYKDFKKVESLTIFNKFEKKNTLNKKK